MLFTAPFIGHGKKDARYQTLDQLHERRKQVLQLHKKHNKVLQKVAMTGLSHSTVCATIVPFDAAGWAEIRPALRGCNKCGGRVRSRAQLLAAQRMIIVTCPEQLKVDLGMGRRASVAQLIDKEFGIKLQVRSIGKYLVRRGFTPQKPIERAFEQNPFAVQARLEGEYPAIKQRTRAGGSEIQWGEETAPVNTDVRVRSNAPACKTPVAMARGGTRQKLSMIATETIQGKTRWMIIDEAFDATKIIEFFQALIKDSGKKVFLIWDNLFLHHSKLVKAWVAERKEQIERFVQPSHSPQLKTEERLNADLKQVMGKRVPVKNKAKLHEAANEHMAMLEKNFKQVMSYFMDRRVRYAA